MLSYVVLNIMRLLAILCFQLLANVLVDINVLPLNSLYSWIRKGIIVERVREILQLILSPLQHWSRRCSVQTISYKAIVTELFKTVYPALSYQAFKNQSEVPEKARLSKRLLKRHSVTCCIFLSKQLFSTHAFYFLSFGRITTCYNNYCKNCVYWVFESIFGEIFYST